MQHVAGKSSEFALQSGLCCEAVRDECSENAEEGADVAHFSDVSSFSCNQVAAPCETSAPTSATKDRV